MVREEVLFIAEITESTVSTFEPVPKIKIPIGQCNEDQMASVAL
jgi:hypothetical protein